MKNILIISTSYPSSSLKPGQEAAGSFVHDFSSELSKNTCVTVVAPGANRCVDDQGSFQVRYFPVPGLPLSLLQPYNPLKWTSIAQALKAGQKAVSEAIETRKPDHVLALWALPCGYWAKTACNRSGTPYSIWALGSDIWTLGKVPFVRKTLRSVLRNSTNCFADGFKLAEDVAAISGKPCDFLPSCRKLPDCKERELATCPPYKLAFLGRWHKNKGIDMLLDSLDLLQADDWKRIQEVRIHGGGPLEELVYANSRKLKDKGCPITVGGYLNAREAAGLYQWADYLLIPSRIESIPVVFSDAMQSSCPVIATPVGDLTHLLKKNKIGLLSDDVSSSSFYKAIEQSIQSSPSDYSNGMREMMDIFTCRNSVSEFVNSLG